MKKMTTAQAKQTQGGIAPVIVAIGCVAANAVAWAWSLNKMRVK